MPGKARVYVDAKLSVVRQRRMRNGFEEQLTILNHGEQPVDLTVRMDAGCDFADLFEVKDAQLKKGRRYQRVEEDRLTLGYQRETFHRCTVVTVSVPAGFDDHGLTMTTHLEPGGRWTATLNVEAVITLPDDANALPRWRKGQVAMSRNIERIPAVVPGWSATGSR